MNFKGQDHHHIHVREIDEEERAAPAPELRRIFKKGFVAVFTGATTFATILNMPIGILKYDLIAGFITFGVINSVTVAGVIKYLTVVRMNANRR